MTDNYGGDLPDVVQGEAQINASIMGSKRRDYESGFTRKVFEKYDLEFKCTDGVLKDIHFDARQGLSRKHGGVQNGPNIEIKGFLLGAATQEGKRSEVVVNERLPLKIDPEDTFDSAGFSAIDYATLKQRLAKPPHLKLVGCYHSHPNHGIKLSEQDVNFLDRHFGESFHVSAIVKPALSQGTQGAVGFFAKPEGSSYLQHRDPVKIIKYDRKGVPIFSSGTDLRWWVKYKRVIIMTAASFVGVGVVAAGLCFGGIICKGDQNKVGPLIELLDVNADEINFGILDPLRGMSQKKTFHNPGDKRADVSFSINGPQSDLFSIQPEVLSLDPGRKETCLLNFAGTPIPNNYQVSLHVSGNLNPTIDIPIRVKVSGNIPPIEKPWPSPGRLKTDNKSIIIEVNHPSLGMQLQGKAEVLLGENKRHYKDTEFTLKPGEHKKIVSLNLGPADLNLKNQDGYLNVILSASGVDPQTGGDVIFKPANLPQYTRGNDSLSLKVEQKKAEGQVFEFRLMLKDIIVGTEVEVFEDSKSESYTTLDLSSGESSTYFYHGSNNGVSSLKFVMQVLEKSNDGKATQSNQKFWRRFEKVVKLQSPDGNFIKTQGKQAQKFITEHKALYRDLGLRDLGEIPRLLYVDDIKGLPNEYYYIALMCESRVPLSKWRNVASLFEELSHSGMGRFAWCDYRDQKKVVLILVVQKDWPTYLPDYKKLLRKIDNTLGFDQDGYSQAQVLKQSRLIHSEGSLEGTIDF